MRIVEEAQVKVGIPMEVLWRSLAKELKSVLPANIPDLIREVNILQGDGGIDTVYLMELNSDVPNMRFQKEKIVEFDESMHQIALQVIEGGRLNIGFIFYKTTFQLTAINININDINGEEYYSDSDETLVNIKVDYETEPQDTVFGPQETINSAVAFVQSLNTFLMNKNIP